MSDNTRRSMNEIFDHVNAGRVDAAEALCRKTLDHRPNDINVLGMLGAILLKTGRNDEAETTLRRTIDLAPGFAKPHEDLGMLYLDRGDPGTALQFLEKAVALNVDEASAHQAMAVALHQLGRHDEADIARRRFIALAPGKDPLGEAELLRQNGEPERAEQVCEELLKREPENIGALRILAVIANSDERFVIAEGLFRRIVNLAPDNAAALFDLARFLGEQSRFAEAIEVLQRAAAITESSPRTWLALGDMLAIVGRANDALDAYEKCLQLEPGEPSALAGRGHMLRIAGRKDDAIASYRQAIDLKPEAGAGWWNLASLHGYLFNEQNIEEMQQFLAAGDIERESEVPLRFALARALEQRGDYDGAWAQYSNANALKRASVKYDPVETEVTHRKIIDTFTTELIRQKHAVTPAKLTPIFIVGMPRSGSTLIEQIISSHSNVSGLGELPYLIMMTHSMRAGSGAQIRYPEAVSGLDDAQLTGLGRSYLHHATTHRDVDTASFTDKMPANFSHIGLIRLILPHAKIIDARRHPLATCVANYRYLFAQGKNQTYDLIELAEYYLLYDEIMRHWDEILPGAILRVNYEDVVADLGGEVRRMLEFCGLPFEENCLHYHETARPVNTASAEQVRQPIYDSALEFWKHYASYLDEVREILEPVLPER
ncbi:MAG: sulfotransferase [Gammaproteobacteria bacterium]|nr:sulfotransferase [Gammaproteobacteria bacterium]